MFANPFFLKALVLLRVARELWNANARRCKRCEDASLGYKIEG